MEREYRFCRACGQVVYRDEDGAAWLLAASIDDYDRFRASGQYFDDGPAADDLEEINTCGCND